MGSFEPAEELEFMIIANRNLLQRNRKLSIRCRKMEAIVRYLAWFYDTNKKETVVELDPSVFQKAKKLCNFYRIRPQQGNRHAQS